MEQEFSIRPRTTWQLRDSKESQTGAKWRNTSRTNRSEFNLGQEPLKLFQIWLRPRQTGGESHWDTRRFPKADRANQFVVLASGFSVDVDALRIRADARVLGATLLAGSELTYTIGNHRHAYLAPARGVVMVNNQRLEVGDGIAASDEPSLTIAAEADAEIVLVVTN